MSKYKGTTLRMIERLRRQCVEASHRGSMASRCKPKAPQRALARLLASNRKWMRGPYGTPPPVPVGAICPACMTKDPRLEHTWIV